MGPKIIIQIASNYGAFKAWLFMQFASSQWRAVILNQFLKQTLCWSHWESSLLKLQNIPSVFCAETYVDASNKLPFLVLHEFFLFIYNV